MSERRLPWSSSEKTTLRTILVEMPLASTSQVTEVFNHRNFRYRSEHAVKVMKRKQLGLQFNSSRGFLSPARQPPPQESLPNLPDPSSGYDWSSFETAIRIPLHPLIAEARRHSAYSAIPDYAPDFSKAIVWPFMLCSADISELKCSNKDKDALKNYLSCILMCRLNKEGASEGAM